MTARCKYRGADVEELVGIVEDVRSLRARKADAGDEAPRCRSVCHTQCNVIRGTGWWGDLFPSSGKIADHEIYGPRDNKITKQ
jgi:hypothetical protein